MLASVRSATLSGIDGQVVAVEVHVARGLPGYGLVGLPAAAGRESRERIRAAFLSSGMEWPLQRITVNLAPGGVRKTGAGLEGAIACALIIAAGELDPAVLAGTGVVGELGLDGSLRSVPGILVLVDALARAGIGRVVVPLAAAREAALVRGVEVVPAASLHDLRQVLEGHAGWSEIAQTEFDATVDGGPSSSESDTDPVDLAEVRGLHHARHALAAAAAGSHHLLLVGPPGVGKTMLARRIGGILGELSESQALEVTRIHSAIGAVPNGRLIRKAPFRAPHHTASAAALIGGGSNGRIRIGEITLAHRGVLFLDELGEFAPSVLDALRQPVEDGRVNISRAGTSAQLPSRFLLVGCCNPCPCGLADSQCHCTDVQQARYRRRLSAPLLDRFDLRLRVSNPGGHEVAGESSAVVRARVEAAIERQESRFRDTAWTRNAHVPAGALDHYLPMSACGRDALRDTCALRGLSGRGAARIRRVARTLADLDETTELDATFVLVAAELREDIV